MKVAVIGTGYVGLVTGTCLAEKGHQVICVDNVPAKIEALNAGVIPIYEPGLKELVDKNTASGRLTFTTETASAVQVSQIIFIAVGTPPESNGEADLSYVRQAAREIGQAMKSYKVIVNKSTVPVGTTDLVAGVIAEQSHYPCDVVSNPEFLREGAAVEDAMHPDRIVIGARSDRAANLMKDLYRTFDAPVVVTDPRSAEMIKYAANAFLAVKISFINEIAGLCERIGGDVLEVARGIGLDPRIGSAFLKAGIGFGGSCFPKDTQALVHMALRVDYRLPVLEGAMGVNERQRTVLVDRLRAALGSLEGKVIGVLGLAFKPNTDDVREAAALEMIKRVVDLGGTVRTFDPQAQENARRELAGAGVDGRVIFCDSGLAVAEGADALILATEWAEFATLPWDELKERMRGDLVLDGRNFLNPDLLHSLGFRYSGIGRGVLQIPDVEPIKG